MGVTRAEADRFLRALPRADRETWQRLPALFGSDDALAAAQKLLRSRDEAIAWGALQVYARRGADPAPLRPLLRHKVPAMRAEAAGALLARGDIAGFPVLLAELVAGAAGRDAAWRGAAVHLARWTADGTLGPPLDADAGQLGAASKAWAAWWEASRRTLRFADGRWSAA